MATVSKWTPFGVALDITATGSTVTRTSATKFTVKINASWETYYEGALTKYGMVASSGGSSVTLKTFSNTAASSGSGSFTGTYSISGNGAATKTITVTFRNFNDDNGDSATKSVSFSVSVPAWTSYAVTYNANGGSGAPGNQTKWKDQTLTLSSTKPTRTGYSFLGWSTSSTASSATYSAGGSYTANAAATLYAVWKANTYVIRYNANGGSGAPGNQTKTYGKALTLSSTKPTRANYTFLGWATSASATTAKYQAGGSYTANAAATLYAVWKLSYTKPTISSLTVSRCDSSGKASDSGTYARVKFNWSTSLQVTQSLITCYNAAGEFIEEYSLGYEGTDVMSGSEDVIIGGSLDVELSYSFEVYFRDGTEYTSRTVTLSGTEFHMDFGQNSVSIGKPAEQIYDENGNTIKAFDVKWRSRFRNHVGIGDKVGHLDGKQGIFLSKEGYIHLQRTTAQGYHPYIGFFFDDNTEADGTIRLNSKSSYMEFLGALGYVFANDIRISSNNKSIYGTDPDGAIKAVFTPQNANGNTVIGYDNYSANNGNTNIYGKDIMFGISNVASGATVYNPYFRQGMDATISVTLYLTGFITNGGTELYFTVPFTKPIVGSPTVTVASIDGFRLRQDDKYTHGSSATVLVKPTSYSGVVISNHGVGVKAVFSNTTNVVNNAPVGIQWSGTITFS